MVSTLKSILHVISRVISMYNKYITCLFIYPLAIAKRALNKVGILDTKLFGAFSVTFYSYSDHMIKSQSTHD